MRSGIWTARPARLSAHGWLLRYGLSLFTVVVALAVALGGTWLLGSTAAYILLPALVGAVALYLGLGSALLAVVFAVVGVQSGSVFLSSHAPGVLPTVLFLLVSSALIALEEVSYRHIRQLAKQQADLEDRIRERTSEVEAANQNLRELSGHLIRLQDEERRRIARELHDSVGQLLVGLSLNLAKVRTGIERLRAEASVLEDSEALVGEVSKEVRTISHLLHPPLLDEAGLSSAIRWYVDGFSQRSSIQVDVDLPGELRRLTRDTEIAIFRVVQESLTNIHRHSGSSQAKVRLRHDDGRVLVEVADTGRGIGPDKLEKVNSTGTSGVGIRGMRERVRQLGGELEVHSSTKGTVLTAMFPVNESPSIETTLKLPDNSSRAAA